MNYDSGAHVFDAAYSWDTEGRMTTIEYGPRYQMQYDVNGRLSGMQDLANGNATVAGATYGVAGEMSALSYFGLTETRQYNTLLQLTRQTVSGQMDMQYVYPAGQNNGRITQSIDGILNETVTYGYDELNRLSSATAGGWSQTYGYDGFGNLTDKSAAGSYVAMHVTFDAATNRQAGQSYDANGNVLTGQGEQYDVENRMISQASPSPGTTYGYDHAGKRVRKSYYPATTEYYFYGVGGQKLATETCAGGACTTAYNVYFGGKLVKSKGAVVVTDRLGSVRSGGLSYFPYGEERAGTADNREQFGTYTRDSATQDYADQRYYGVGTGRFGTPDPYMANSGGSGDPAEPASWNRYGYVIGDPVNYIDPSGQVYGPAGPDPDPEPPEPPQKPGTPVKKQEPKKPNPERKPQPGPGQGPAPCANANAVAFVKAHLDDATILAGKMNIPVEFVMAVSEAESTFGKSNIFKHTNNYFGQHAGAANATGTWTTDGGVEVSSYLGLADPYMASGLDFVASEKARASNVTDPLTFFTLIHDKYGVGTADYTSTMVDVARMAAARIKDCI